MSTHFCLFKTILDTHDLHPSLSTDEQREVLQMSQSGLSLSMFWGDNTSSEDFYTSVMDTTWKLTLIFSQWRRIFFMHLVREKNKSRENLFSCAWNYLQNKTAQGAELPFFSQDLFTSSVAELNFHQATLFTVLLKVETFPSPLYLFSLAKTPNSNLEVGVMSLKKRRLQIP